MNKTIILGAVCLFSATFLISFYSQDIKENEVENVALDEEQWTDVESREVDILAEETLTPLKQNTLNSDRSLNNLNTDSKDEKVVTTKLPSGVDVDEIGGYYDENAAAPESEIPQDNTITTIGYYEPNATSPEDSVGTNVELESGMGPGELPTKELVSDMPVID